MAVAAFLTYYSVDQATDFVAYLQYLVAAPITVAVVGSVMAS